MYSNIQENETQMTGTTKILTVSELTSQIKEILTTAFPAIWVEGEISNFKYHSSGHMYFTLKDEKAELRAVMFRGYNQYLRFTPENGMKVLVQGGITVYELRGTYQLVIKQMQPAGIGTLYLAFEALKKKLSEEGLFDKERKKLLPKYPFRVGVITSGTGAAIQDITNILTRRSPHVEMILRSTTVQGEGAAEDIVAALQEFETYRDVDVLIVGRGGGSLEDLWAFNEEKVARAIGACPIPIISAVGHETDFTIADFVADYRAPTPSAAAEIVSISRDDLLRFICEAERRIHDLLINQLQFWWQRLDGLTTRYGFQQPQILVQQIWNRLKELEERVIHRIQMILNLQLSKFQGLNQRLIAASPRNILERGYSIAYTLPEKQIVNKVVDMITGEEFGLWMSDGELIAETKRILQSKSKK